MARRRAKPVGVTTIYWRDIPAQVTASAGGAPEKVLLEPRFQNAIDRAAAVAGLTETEAYVSQWRKETVPLPEGVSPADAAATRAESINNAYPRPELEKLVADGGANDAAPSTLASND